MTRLAGVVLIATILTGCADRIATAPDAARSGISLLAPSQASVFIGPYEMGRSVMRVWYESDPNTPVSIDFSQAYYACLGGPITEGEHTAFVSGLCGLTNSTRYVKAQWPGTQHWWVADTLFQFYYHPDARTTYGGRTPDTCYYNSPTWYSWTDAFNTTSPCNANFIQMRYRIYKAWVASPMWLYMGGGNTIDFSFPRTFGVQAYGGSSIYWYAWERAFAGGEWQPVCGNDAQCTVYQDVNQPDYSMRVTVTTTTNHNNYTGAYDTYSDVAYIHLAHPPSVWISGPSYIRYGAFCTWYAYPSGGRAPYSYQWSGVASGTDAYIQASPWEDGYLYLQVTDADGRTANTSTYVMHDWDGDSCNW
jgi:hypothetical protein